MNEYSDLLMRLSARATLLRIIGETTAAEAIVEAMNAIYNLRDRLEKVESYLDYIDTLNKRRAKA